MKFFVLSICSMVVLLMSCTDAVQKDVLSSSKYSETINIEYSPDYQQNQLQLKLNDSIEVLDTNSVEKILFELNNSSHLINYKKGIINSYFLLAQYSYLKYEYHNSLKYLHEGLNYCNHTRQSPSVLVTLYSKMSHNFLVLGNIDSATYYAYKGLKITDEHPEIEKESLIDLYVNVGKLWAHKDFDRSIKYLNKANKLSIQLNDSMRDFDIVATKGAVYVIHNMLDKGLYFINSIIEDSTRHVSLNTKWYANNLAGIIYGKKGDFRKGIGYLNNALLIAEKLNSPIRIFESKNGLAAYYSNIKEYNKAMELFEELMEIEKKNIFERDESIVLLYHNYAITNFKLGRFKKSSISYEIAIQYRDSFYRVENSRILNDIETQYQVLKKDKLLADQQLKLAQQKNWIIGISSAAVLLLGLTIGLVRRKRHKEQMAKLTATLAGAEQERVRMAKELHDGVLSRLSAVKLNFATLPGIQEHTQEPEGFKEALQQLELSILELRTTSHNLYPEILEQEGLAKATQLFCEKISNIAPVYIDFQSIGMLPADLSKAFELNLYRMLQELVQNIVKHSSADAAVVQMVVKEDWLHVSIEDNGKGLPADWKNGGMGLAQMDKRLKPMHGKMEVESNGGTNIYLEFNLLKVKNDEPHN